MQRRLTRRFTEHSLLISDDLRQLLPPDWPVTPLGPQPIKGWPEPLEVFGLPDWTLASPAERAHDPV